MRDLRSCAFESLDELFAHLGELNEEILTADDFDEALAGVVQSVGRPVLAAYDYEKCVNLLVERDGMDADSAIEYLDYNTFGGWVGECTPGAVSWFDQAESEFFRDQLLDGDPDTILLTGLDQALVGEFSRACKPTVALYDLERCLELIMQPDALSREDALAKLLALVGEATDYAPAFVTCFTCAEE